VKSRRAAPRDVLVREVKWTDFDDLVDVYYRLYDERAAGNLDLGIPLFPKQPDRASEVDWFTGMYKRILSGDTVARVAEADGKAVGGCFVTRTVGTAGHEAGHVGVLGILVREEYRGRGAGTALLAGTIEACRGVFDLVKLTVFSVNTRAAELYRRFGFVTVGRVPAAIHRGDRYLDEEVMILDLRPETKR
jgi:ribosomal protein S18 acetylase RimI-like enzyme